MQLLIKKPSGVIIYKTDLKPRIRQSTSSREKFTQLKNCLIFTKPAHRVRLARLRLGCHILRIQSVKYENRGALIPVEERTCFVRKENAIECEQHFLMRCQGCTTMRRELHSHILNAELVTPVKVITKVPSIYLEQT